MCVFHSNNLHLRAFYWRTIRLHVPVGKALEPFRERERCDRILCKLTDEYFRKPTWDLSLAHQSVFYEATICSEITAYKGWQQTLNQPPHRDYYEVSSYRGRITERCL